jgi:hypothetical protein
MAPGKLILAEKNYTQENHDQNVKHLSKERAQNERNVNNNQFDTFDGINNATTPTQHS